MGPTPPPSPRPGHDLITSLTLCTPRGPLSTGMWERAWRRESSPRPGRTSPPSRRITRRLASTQLRLMMMREKSINFISTSTDFILHRRQRMYLLNLPTINEINAIFGKKKKKKKKIFFLDPKKKKKKKKKKS